jgi:hypothetical protein
LDYARSGLNVQFADVQNVNSVPTYLIVVFLLIVLVSAAPANDQTESQLVDVGDGVKVEVLDWGGVGQSVVLLGL